MTKSPVRVAVFGGTGYAGSNIAREAVARGLAVTAVARNAATTPLDGVAYVQGSYTDPVLLKQLAADHDVLVFAVQHDADPRLVDVLPQITEAAVASGTRVAFVGGAGSTLVREGGPRVVDTPEFHEEWKAEALAGAATLDALRVDESEVRWFFVSPAGVFGAWAEGEATGAYRTSDDVLLVDDQGVSEISGADFALAFVDEILEPRHENKRFHVAH